MNARDLFVGGSVSVGAALAGLSLARFNMEMTALKAKLLTGSNIAKTRVGPVEYALAGEEGAPPVLVVHGIGGGYDQGLLVTELERNNPFRIIAVSRPGYLRTPLSVGATPEQQADAHAALLDALDVERVAIVGLSAGGPSSLLFALRHPDRCWALVMMSAVSGPLVPQLALWQKAVGALLNTDPGLWLFGRLAEDQLLQVSGISADLFERISNDPSKLRVVRSILEPLPISLRRAGFNADMRQFPQLPVYPMEDVRVPTMVVHGTADTIVPPTHAAFVEGRVPDAQALFVEGGGHLCAATHKEQVLPRVTEFLMSHAPARVNSPQLTASPM
jgi:pimeloyl-ACP methyl ester carboxylesterase